MDGKGSERFDTVVVGAGQAGLSAGYHLKQAGRSFVILDANDRIGGSWRKRYDSLQPVHPVVGGQASGLALPEEERTVSRRGSRWPTTSRPTPEGSTCRCAPGSTCSGSREWETGTSCPSPTVGSRPTT